MHPELFTIPFLNISVKSYGVMTVLGFLAGMFLARWRARKLGENPEQITNYALMALILGIVGARVMYVIHYWEQFADKPWLVFAIWAGGQEFLGGFIGAVGGLWLWLKIKKQSFLKVTDILAPSLALGLAIGRLGCFLNGCCFGAPCELPWAVRFPALNPLTVQKPGGEKEITWRYSPPYADQLFPNIQRDPEARPRLTLPDDFNAQYENGRGHWVAHRSLIPLDDRDAYYPVPMYPDNLTDAQRKRLLDGEFPMHSIHPTQLYAFLNGVAICLILNWVFGRRRYVGQISVLLLILYGLTRFGLEMLRADNPIEFDGLTVSQNLAIAAVAGGIALHFILRKSRRIEEK